MPQDKITRTEQLELLVTRRRTHILDEDAEASRVFEEFLRNAGARTIWMAIFYLMEFLEPMLEHALISVVGDVSGPNEHTEKTKKYFKGIVGLRNMAWDALRNKNWKTNMTDLRNHSSLRKLFELDIALVIRHAEALHTGVNTNLLRNYTEFIFRHVDVLRGMLTVTFDPARRERIETFKFTPMEGIERLTQLLVSNCVVYSKLGVSGHLMYILDRLPFGGDILPAVDDAWFNQSGLRSNLNNYTNETHCRGLRDSYTPAPETP